jgi:hypothetical protein
MILNIKGAEANLSTTANGDNFSLSSCVKINVTAATGDVVITLNTEDDTLIGSTTLVAPSAGGTSYFVEKSHTDKIVSDTASVKATPVGFTIS